MSEVILFNHIPKTAGSTMKHVLWRVVGSDRVLYSLGEDHRERVASIASQLDRRLDRQYVVASHVGYGVEGRLPARHSYPAFTLLRDPIQRTLSRYWHYRTAPGRASGAERIMPLEEWLEKKTLHTFNAQTAFLGGIWLSHHLDGVPLDRSRFDQPLLAEAKRNLDSHVVVGLTERFDETLLLLRDAFGWPLRKTTYRRKNTGPAGRRTSTLTESELEAVRANNELDIELYDFGRGLFEARLAERMSNRDERLRSFHRLNRAYGRVYPVTIPARTVVRSVRGSRS